MMYIMIVNNLRGIELYGSVHTSISSGEKKDNKVPFTLSEEFIGQSRIFFQTILLVNKIQLDLQLMECKLTSKL